MRTIKSTFLFLVHMSRLVQDWISECNVFNAMTEKYPLQSVFINNVSRFSPQVFLCEHVHVFALNTVYILCFKI